MARKKKEVAPRQPTELGALKVLVDEFMNRYETLDYELEQTKEDIGMLVEEYSDRLDTKTLKQAMRTVKIRKKVDRLDTYNTFVDILDKRMTV